ncbi:hypothetical protein ACS0TY_020254 [Phlomoides rotata]
MEVKLMCMKAGDDATSYTNNSGLQNIVIPKTWCLLDETLHDMFTNGLPKRIRMADLGCGPGPNTLLVVSHIMDTIKHLYKLNNLPQIEVFVNDLPDNDFNNLFKILKDQKNGNERRELLDACFIYGAPGSFHENLFPTNTLHFVYSSYSLHWLSQVPEGVGKKNKENIHMTMMSPPEVFEAYAEQFQRDFTRFLRIRGEEIVDSGCMVLTFIGRRFVDPSPNDGVINLYTPLVQILLHMVAQGLVKEEDLYSFNVPLYPPCTQEIEAIIRDEGSFKLEKMAVFEVPWDANVGDDDYDDIIFDKHESGKIVAACVRAFLEPLLLSHFGPSLDLDGIFDIYAHKMGDHLATERSYYFSPVISLTRKLRI